jgi:hypothetical protein
MVFNRSNLDWTKTFKEIQNIVNTRHGELSLLPAVTGIQRQFRLLFAPNSVLNQALLNNGDRLLQDIENFFIDTFVPTGRNEYEVFLKLIKKYLDDKDINFNLINVFLKDQIGISSSNKIFLMDSDVDSAIKIMVDLLNQIFNNDPTGKTYYLNFEKVKKSGYTRFIRNIEDYKEYFGLNYDSSTKQYYLINEFIQALLNSGFLNVKNEFNKEIFYLFRLSFIRFKLIDLSDKNLCLFVENLCRILAIILLNSYIDSDPNDNKFALDLLDETELLNEVSKIIGLVIGGSSWFSCLKSIYKNPIHPDSKKSSLQSVLFYFYNGQPIEIPNPITNRIRGGRISLRGTSGSGSSAPPSPPPTP